jgi:hypothetical protein
MKAITVPDYVADEFNQPLRHPSSKSDAVSRSLLRVYRLINEALKGISNPQWEVDGNLYHSTGRDEPYGFERVEDMFYIYAEERGWRKPIAVFKDDHMAAKYFVWLVSKGSRSIDWSLFLDMEP